MRPPLARTITHKLHRPIRRDGCGNIGPRIEGLSVGILFVHLCKEGIDGLCSSRISGRTQSLSGRGFTIHREQESL